MFLLPVMHTQHKIEKDQIKKRNIKKAYIFFRTWTCFSLRSYSCLIFFFSASTSCNFSILNSYKQTNRWNNFHSKPKTYAKRKNPTTKSTLNKKSYFFSGDGDLVSLLLRFLADESHHLLDLLRDICIVHLRIWIWLRWNEFGLSSSPLKNSWNLRFLDQGIDADEIGIYTSYSLIE